jgi:hypothetical protein
MNELGQAKKPALLFLILVFYESIAERNNTKPVTIYPVRKGLSNGVYFLFIFKTMPCFEFMI